MARLYDDLRAQNIHRNVESSVTKSLEALGMGREGKDSTIRLFEQAPVIVADNVCEYYFAENPREVWDMDDFPSVAPPFASFFIECKHPSKIVSEKYGTTEWDLQHRPRRWGMFVRAPRIPQGFLPQGWLDNLRKKYPEVGTAEHPSWVHELVECTERVSVTGGWIMNCLLFAETPDHELDCLWEITIGVDDNGRAITVRKDDDTEYFSYTSEPKGWARNLVLKMRSTPNHPMFAMFGLTPKKFAIEMTGMMKPLFLALSFMHCKNVAQIENKPDEKLQKARVKRGRLPLTRYYTLQIDPNRTPGQYKARQAAGENGNLPLHIVRGHFAYYGIEGPGGWVRKKLFGKYSGRYFIPQMVRGSKQHGEVIKDYQVKSDTEDGHGEHDGGTGTADS